jgi:DNA primase
MGPETIEALTGVLAELTDRPGARVVIATDADKAGEHYADQIHKMAATAGIPSERFLPPPGHKDWNEFLQTGAGRGVP